MAWVPAADGAQRAAAGGAGTPGWVLRSSSTLGLLSWPRVLPSSACSGSSDTAGTSPVCRGHPVSVFSVHTEHDLAAWGCVSAQVAQGTQHRYSGHTAQVTLGHKAHVPRTDDTTLSVFHHQNRHCPGWECAQRSAWALENKALK